jgi:hypothetical protein
MNDSFHENPFARCSAQFRHTLSRASITIRITVSLNVRKTINVAPNLAEWLHSVLTALQDAKGTDLSVYSQE